MKCYAIFLDLNVWLAIKLTNGILTSLPFNQSEDIHPDYPMVFYHVKLDNYTLDVDSTILTRYGDQQGAKRGFNPKKPGRNSHHPLLAFVDECKMVANF